MKLDNLLRLALIALLENKVIVASWGISNIVVNPTILKFDVDGMKYHGTVCVEVSGTSGYIIRIGDKSYNVCNSENLIKVLDENIECSSEYILDLKKWIAEKGLVI